MEDNILIFIIGILSWALIINSITISRLKDDVDKMNNTLHKIANVYGLNDINKEEIDNEIYQLLGDGKKVRAVKRYREITGLSLKESKEYVDSLNEKK